MANHAWAVFRKNINLEVLEGYLKTYNTERFGGCLKIERDETSITVRSPEGWKFYYWVRSKRTIAWRHQHGDVDWWLSESLGHYMARNFQADCVIRDEGIDDKMTADFDLQYPTAEDWARVSFFGSIIPHPERKVTDPIYWKSP